MLVESRKQMIIMGNFIIINFIRSYIAWSLIYLKTQLSKQTLGESVLNELMSLTPSRPEAYIVLWADLYQRQKDFARALTIAE